MSATRYLRIEPGELAFIEPFSASDHQRSLRLTNISEHTFSLVGSPHQTLKAVSSERYKLKPETLTLKAGQKAFIDITLLLNG
jgi:hypothetical protein